MYKDEQESRNERMRSRDLIGLLRGDSRQPKFGEWMRGIWASEDNPIRDGMYVKTIHRKGRVNRGRYYQLTNGKGKFWEFEAVDTLYLGKQQDMGN